MSCDNERISRAHYRKRLNALKMQQNENKLAQATIDESVKLFVQQATKDYKQKLTDDLNKRAIALEDKKSFVEKMQKEKECFHGNFSYDKREMWYSCGYCQKDFGPTEHSQLHSMLYSLH